MFLKKVLNQPNLVGTMLIALMVCAGFVYAFAFDGFNVETVPGSEVETWLAQAGAGSYSGGSYSCNNTSCNEFRPGDGVYGYALCPARGSDATQDCNDCHGTSYCTSTCNRLHPCTEAKGKKCVHIPKRFKNTGCSEGSDQRDCVPGCKGK